MIFLPRFTENLSESFTKCQRSFFFVSLIKIFPKHFMPQPSSWQALPHGFIGSCCAFSPNNDSYLTTFNVFDCVVIRSPWHDFLFSLYFPSFYMSWNSRRRAKKDPTNGKSFLKAVHEIKYFPHVSINLLSRNVHLNTNKKQKRTFLVYRIFLFFQ